MGREVDVAALGELLIDFTEAGYGKDQKKLFEQNPGGAPANLLTVAKINLADKPGQLSGVCSVIAQLGGNIISVTHERLDASVEINGCTLRIDMETRNPEHIEQVRQGLRDAGYKLVD